MKSIKKRIYFYCRNSTIQQEYQYQINNLETHFKHFNNLELIEIVGEKISGFKSEQDRPEMARLLKLVDDRMVDEIWVNDFTRLSRAAINLQQIVIYCAERGVNIFFKDKNLNTLDEDGKINSITKLIISILAQFAEMDANNFKEKGKQGKISKAKQGNYVGGQLQLGYKYINNTENKTKKIVIDENRKKVVEFIFNEYANQNKSLGQITNELNNLKIIDSNFDPAFKYEGKEMSTFKAEQWAQTTVKRILNCTWYALGYRMHKDEKILLDDSLKFIDLDLYLRANEMLKKNKYKGTQRVHTYLLKDLMFCSCGEKMSSQQKTKRYVAKDNSEIVGFYQCSANVSNRYNKNVKCKHDACAIKAETIENVIWLFIKNKLPKFKIEVEKRTIIKEEFIGKMEFNKQLIVSIENITIKNLKATRQRTIEVYARFNGDETVMSKTIDDIDKQVFEQESEIKRLITENNKHQISIQNLNVAEEIEKNILLIESDKSLIKEYISRLIDKIVVCVRAVNSKTNIIEIHFKTEVNFNNTFLIFNSKITGNNKYYYINEIDGISVIIWSHQKKLFRILDIEKKITKDVRAIELINYMDSFYDEEFDELEPEVSIIKYTKDYSIFNIIEGGQSKLKIVTPFV
jgi:DNA invertase Pin-like site-specific DNA recombinase